jgi:hypothetical protein
VTVLKGRPASAQDTSYHTSIDVSQQVYRLSLQQYKYSPYHALARTAVHYVLATAAAAVVVVADVAVAAAAAAAAAVVVAAAAVTAYVAAVVPRSASLDAGCQL